MLNLDVILKVTKFGWIENILKLNKIKSWIRGFLDCSKSYTLLKSRFIKLNFLKTREFKMFSTYCY